MNDHHRPTIFSFSLDPGCSSQTWPSNCNRVVGLSLLVQRATHTLLSEDIFFYIPIPQTDNFQYLVTWFESRLTGLLQDLPISVDFLLKFYGNFKPSIIHVTKIDRFILQMYNFPSLSLDTLDYIPQVHLLFQS